MTAENMVIFSLYETIFLVFVWSLLCFGVGFLVCLYAWDK